MSASTSFLMCSQQCYWVSTGLCRALCLKKKKNSTWGLVGLLLALVLEELGCMLQNEFTAFIGKDWHARRWRTRLGLQGMGVPGEQGWGPLRTQG